MKLDLSALEALSDQLSRPLDDFEHEDLLDRLFDSAPSLIALAREALMAREWLAAHDLYVRTTDARDQEMLKPHHRLQEAREAYRAIAPVPAPLKNLDTEKARTRIAGRLEAETYGLLIHAVNEIQRLRALVAAHDAGEGK